MTSDLSCDVTLAESSMSQPLFLLCNFSPDCDTEGSSINVNSSMKEFCFSLLFLHSSPQLGASHCVPAWPCSPVALCPLPRWWLRWTREWHVTSSSLTSQLQLTTSPLFCGRQGGGYVQTQGRLAREGT